MPAFIDLRGQRFGRLIVIERVPDPRAGARWRCVCDCGAETVVRALSLRRGETRSCGCYSREQKAEICLARGTHGYAARGKKPRVYAIWSGMIQRCKNPRVPKYQQYGGRGIRVCDRWLKFENFLADMGEPAPGQSIDRIDPNGNYEPGNCHWLDERGQQNNRRSNRLIAFRGETMTLQAWAERTGLKRETIARRLELGWDVGRALTEPV